MKTDITDITLRDPFSYSLNILIALALIVIVPPLIIWLIKLVQLLAGNKKKKVKAKKNKKITSSDVIRLKKKCLGRIDEIENIYRSGKMEYRLAYIELSYIVRDFVQRVCGNNATNLTLNEIKELSLPDLYYLIEEFYEPEFAMDNEGKGPENPFDDARKVIEKWN